MTFTPAVVPTPRAARPALRPERTVFQNGSVLLVKPTHTTPAVSIVIAVKSGSVADPADAPGATWLLSRVIDRGTSTRSAADIADLLDGRGVSLSIGVTRHLLTVSTTCLEEDFEVVLALMGDAIRHPSLPESELTLRRGEVITAIRQDEDSPATCAFDGLMRLLYPEHPYGRPVKGSADSVERLTRAQLQRLHASTFAPSSLVTVVAGDVEPSRARTAVERAFGDWSAEAASPVSVPAAAPSASRRRLVLPMMNKAQADIAYGFVTIRRSDPDFYALSLANHVLGQYALGGRLGDSIRERQGMAYYVSSSVDASIVEGPFVVQAGVSPANVDRAVASIDEELKRLVGDGLTQQELDDSRHYMVGAMPRMIETNGGIAGFLLQAEFYGLGLDYDARLPDWLGAVTLEQANAAARRLLHPEAATVVVAGPYRDA